MSETAFPPPPLVTGYEPWRSDGTVAGTTLLRDIWPGSNDSNAVEFTPWNGAVYFSADDLSHGIETWRTDGTSAGTSLLVDINPGAPDGSPQLFTLMGGDMYFQANDDLHGTELWVCAPGTPLPTDAGADGGGSCPGTQPPSMVRVGAYCVDTTEVENSQYQAFLTAKGSNTSGQPSYCSFNTTYQPTTTGICTGYTYDPVGHPHDPVVCIDWCDATAYCAWAGKRLCGSTGGGSGTPYYATDPGHSQWMNACSHGGTFAYPYGNTYVAGVCVDTAYADGGQTLQPVLAAAQCEGGFPGIYGMSGNAAEFEDSCTLYNDASDSCEVRGGAYDGTSNLACAGNNLVRRDWAYMDTGFRCCGEVH